MIVGITGHSNLDEATAASVRDALRGHLAALDQASLVGVTCLARGADQIFADLILDLGGKLEVIAPAADYFDRVPDPDARARCDDYLAQAVSVRTLPFEHAGHDAYTAASKALVDRSELLLAVWDGSTNSGTGEAVAYARTRDRQVAVVWPDGAGPN